MALTNKEKILKIKEKQKQLDNQLAEIKKKQFSKVLKLFDKYDFAEWDESNLEEAFKFIKSEGENSFIKKEENTES